MKHQTYKRWVQLTVKGFTLMEILLGMALTSLLVLAGHSIIIYFSKLMFNIQDYSARQKEIVELYATMQLDFDHASSVVWSNAVECKIENYTAIYYFFDSLIVRDFDVQADTFYVKMQEMPILSYHPEHSQLIESVQINCINQEQMLPVMVRKKYAIGNLIDMDN